MGNKGIKKLIRNFPPNLFFISAIIAIAITIYSVISGAVFFMRNLGFDRLIAIAHFLVAFWVFLVFVFLLAWSLLIRNITMNDMGKVNRGVSLKKKILIYLTYVFIPVIAYAYIWMIGWVMKSLLI